MTLPYSKKQLDHAKKHQVPLLKLDIDCRHMQKSPNGLGLISRTLPISPETAEKIMKILDEDTTKATP